MNRTHLKALQTAVGGLVAVILILELVQMFVDAPPGAIPVTEMDVEQTTGLLYAIGGQAEAEGFGRLNRHEQLMLSAWSGYGYLSNGGFRYLHEGPTDLAWVAEGFRVLGFDEAAQACQRTLVRLTEDEGFPAHDPEARRNHLDRIDWEQFGPEEDEIYRTVDFEPLAEAIRGYIRSNEHAFDQWYLDPKAQAPEEASEAGG